MLPRKLPIALLLSATLSTTLLACASEATGDLGGASAEITKAPAKPQVLVPTSRAALTACATELAATYCSDAEVAAAKAHCESHLPASAKADCDPARGCVFALPTDRAGSCREGITYASKAECQTPQKDDCSFYASCMEPVHACGADGYARSFGQPLCYKFLEHRQEFSPHAQHWLKRVRTCLQEQLVPLLASPNQTCSSLEDAAYASHVSCYTEPSDSICQVALPDLLVLFGIIHNQLFSTQGFKQVTGVAHACVAQFFHLPGSGPSAGASHAGTGAQDNAQDSASDQAKAAFFQRVASAETDEALQAVLREASASKDVFVTAP